jgi:hypothetical protein
MTGEPDTTPLDSKSTGGSNLTASGKPPTPMMKFTFKVFLFAMFVMVTVLFRAAMEHPALQWPLSAIMAGAAMWTVVSLARKVG